MIASVMIISSIAVPAEKTSDILQNLLKVKRDSLQNGLKILILEDHSAPLVSFQMFVHTGSRNEKPGITGISHLFEHMMFEGSKKYGPEEHANIVNRNGGSLNAFTTEDVTVFFENIVSDKLELVVSLEAERLANLDLSEKKLASERKVVMEERRYRVDDNNFGVVNEQLLANAYTAHPYGWNVVGWMSDLESITLKDCQDYHRIHYAPNNVTLVIVGDIDTDQTVKIVDKYFGKLKCQPAPEEIRTVEPAQMGERIAYISKQAQLPMLMAGYHIPPMGHEDIYPLKVLQKILSDGQSSRLYKKLVYDEQVALYAGGDVDEREDPGLFYLYCGMSIGHDIEVGKNMLFGEIDSFAEKPVTDHELEKAKNQLEDDFISRLQTNMSKGMRLGFYEVLLGDYTKIFDEADRLESVTKEDIQRVAKKYLNPDNRTTIILIPENS